MNRPKPDRSKRSTGSDPDVGVDPGPRHGAGWAALVYAVATLVLGFPALLGKFLVSPISDQYVGGYAVREFGTSIDVIAPASFISLVVPLCVFFAFQRYFVQGLLAGSVK